MNIRDYSEGFIGNYLRILTSEYLIKQSKYTNFYVKIRENKIVGFGAIGPYWGVKWKVVYLLYLYCRSIMEEVLAKK